MIDLSGLNMPQREAVECTEGPLLILAGAGSGKTRVLTTRIAYLIYEKRVAPWNILAITFTNKAAQEMRDRIVALVGQDGEKVWASTFHSICVRILRNEINAIGYDDSFVIYDDADQLTLMKKILKEMNLDEKKFNPKSVLASISTHKNELRTPSQAAYIARGDYGEEIRAELYQKYQDYLKENNAVDFDDLIMLTVQLFRENSDILQRYQDRFRYILVDEYQDTNVAQYQLVRLLAEQYQNLCVVGDDDQSIYQWRGADLRNIMNFEQDYPTAKVIKLEENYRSTQPILDAAYYVVKHNMGRKEKRLWTEKNYGDLPALYSGYDEKDEALFIARTVRVGVQEENRQYKDYAVLCRATAQFRIIEETLIKENIPYRIFGGQKFYGRKEIKDIMSYLKIIVNPADTVSAERALGTPKRGIGDTSWAKILQFSRDNGISISEAMSRAEESGLGKKYALTLSQFGHMLDTFRILADTLSVTELTEMIMQETGYVQMLEAEKTVEAETRLDNLQEFLSITTAYDNRDSEDGLPKSLQNFLAEVSLYSDLDEMDDADNAVNIMTMHGAKGLEFPVVFVTGMEEGVFPHSRAVYSLSDDEMEEERRLCYVAITRAKEQVYLTRAGERMLYGKSNYNPVSRFVKEIPETMLNNISFDGMRRSVHHEKPKPVFRDQIASHNFGFSSSGKSSGLGGSSVGASTTNPNGASATGVSATASGSGASSGGTEYAVNDVVIHKKWGRGVVVGVSGSGDEYSIKVIFPDMGMKDLFVKYAPITKEQS